MRTLAAPLGWIGIFACTAGTLFVNVARTGGREQWRRAASFGTAGLLSLTSGIMLVLASFFRLFLISICATPACWSTSPIS